MVMGAGWLCNKGLINSLRLSNVSQWWGMCVCVLVSTRAYYHKMLSSQSDVRPGSNVKTWVKKTHTHTTVDHSLASTWVYSIITSLCRPDLNQSWRVGVELLISPTTSAYSTIFTCFTILLKCKALQGEITFNQSRFPAASGTRVYTPLSFDEQGLGCVILSE